MVLTENRPKIVKNSLKNGRKNQRPKLNGVEKGRSEVEKVDGPILRWNEMKLDDRNNKKWKVSDESVRFLESVHFQSDLTVHFR